MTKLIVVFCKLANAPKNPDTTPQIISRGTSYTALFLNYTGGNFSINLKECEMGQIREPDLPIPRVRRTAYRKEVNERND
jgi:hypothetical protein